MAPPAIAPRLGLEGLELEPDPLSGLVPPLELSGVVVFKAIMVSRSRTLQPLAGAFLDEPPVLLLSD